MSSWHISVSAMKTQARICFHLDYRVRFHVWTVERELRKTVVESYSTVRCSTCASSNFSVFQKSLWEVFLEMSCRCTLQQVESEPERCKLGNAVGGLRTWVSTWRLLPYTFELRSLNRFPALSDWIEYMLNKPLHLRSRKFQVVLRFGSFLSTGRQWQILQWHKPSIQHVMMGFRKEQLVATGAKLTSFEVVRLQKTVRNDYMNTENMMFCVIRRFQEIGAKIDILNFSLGCWKRFSLPNININIVVKDLFVKCFTIIAVLVLKGSKVEFGDAAINMSTHWQLSLLMVASKVVQELSHRIFFMLN